MKRIFVSLLVVMFVVCSGSLSAFAQEKQEKQEETTQAAEKEEVKKIDVNSATQQELESLPDIGPKLAQAIIDNRPYANIDDVKTKVKGIGDKKFEAIKDLIEAMPIEEKAEGLKQDETQKEDAKSAETTEKKE